MTAGITASFLIIFLFKQFILARIEKTIEHFSPFSDKNTSEKMQEDKKLRNRSRKQN